MRPSLSSTSTRTFLAWPLVVGAEQLLARRRLHPVGLPLLVAGYSAYRLAGAYRLPRAGGPAGMSQGMPERLVREGPYGWTRNPMYAGHLLFLTGLAVTTRSPLAVAALAGHLPWFRSRVRRDEARLRARFGTAYDEYCATVPRWLPLRLGTRNLPGRTPGPGEPGATCPEPGDLAQYA
jgi:protein-S-isoprenylcysteine O-methyltransferase Ste14